MKLELKHLAPYLPYGLKLYSLSEYRISKVIVNWGVRNCSDYPLMTYEDGTAYGRMLSEVKPILRPMSDLEDGKQWIDKLQEECNHTVSYNEGSFSDSYSDEFTIDWLPQICFNWLVKNHFDVFDLIPAGLAIDINTVD